MNNYLAHQNLIKKFKIDAQKEISGIRIFDNVVGLFYRKTGQPIKIGIKGMSDCYALIPTKFGLIYIALEFKTGSAVQSKEQKIWESFIKKNNGIYMVIREDYADEIEKLKKVLLHPHTIVNIAELKEDESL